MPQSWMTLCLAHQPIGILELLVKRWVSSNVFSAMILLCSSLSLVWLHAKGYLLLILVFSYFLVFLNQAFFSVSAVAFHTLTYSAVFQNTWLLILLLFISISSFLLLIVITYVLDVYICKSVKTGLSFTMMSFSDILLLWQSLFDTLCSIYDCNGLLLIAMLSYCNQWQDDLSVGIQGLRDGARSLFYFTLFWH